MSGTILSFRTVLSRTQMSWTQMSMHHLFASCEVIRLKNCSKMNTGMAFVCILYNLLLNISLSILHRIGS